MPPLVRGGARNGRRGSPSLPLACVRVRARFLKEIHCYCERIVIYCMVDEYVAKWAAARHAALADRKTEGAFTMYTPAALLDAVIKTLTQEKGDILISTWFSDTEAIAIKDGKFIIAAPSELFRDTLTQRFTDNVSEIIDHLSGVALQPVYLAPEEAAEWKRLNDDGIYSRYTFERFIVGNSNKFAHAAAYAVSQNPAALYNPLFIYGQSGLGKTHLLYAIAGEIQKKRRNFKIVYKKGDDFTVELVEAIQNGTVSEFRSRYRQADLLLVDDIQFIAGKERTQEEFFHTFNALHEAGKQVVLTSDRPPKEIAALVDRLRTRFEAGLLADIQPPDFETRMALVAEKSAMMDVKLPQDVIEYIASSINNNVRELEGAVKKIAAIHSLMGKKIDLPMAQDAIRDIFKERPGLNPTPELILEEVAAFYNLPPEKIRSKSRTADIVVPRQITCYLIRELTALSLPDIGKFVNQHHTTVLYGCEKLAEEMERNEELNNTVNDLRQNIQSR